MKTSRKGLLFIARREALVLVAYQDGPHMSIGFGSNNPKLKAGDTITVQEAFALLKKDVEAREARVGKLLKVPVEQHVFDCLMSLHYQSGNRFTVDTGRHPGPFIIDLINAGQLAEAAATLPECDTNLAGEHVPGLKKRRILEQTMMLTGDYGELSPIPFWRGNPNATKREQYVLQEGDL